MVERRTGRERGVCGRRITELGRMRGRVRSLRTPVTWIFCQFWIGLGREGLTVVEWEET
jgi:hypothetical protein